MHQPPASIHAKQQHQQQIKVVNQAPLAGGWLIGESAKGTLFSNDQQVFQNILNNNTSSNNISVNSTGGTVVYSGNCISSTSETATNTALHASSLSGAASALASGDSNKYGNTSKTATSSELLANGHGPRREVNTISLCQRNFMIWIEAMILRKRIAHHRHEILPIQCPYARYNSNWIIKSLVHKNFSVQCIFICRFYYINITLFEYQFEQFFIRYFNVAFFFLSI